MLSIIFTYILHYSFLKLISIQGKAGKYTQYSAQTGVTKTNQSTMDETTTNSNNNTTPGDDSSSPLSLSEFITQLPTLAADINNFATARSWAQFHTPRNLVLALMGEFGELAELLQWKGDNDDDDDTDMMEPELLDKLSQELADVTIYLLRLATVCKVVEPVCEAMKE
jgi:dCTP diphosphatase